MAEAPDPHQAPPLPPALYLEVGGECVPLRSYLVALGDARGGIAGHHQLDPAEWTLPPPPPGAPPHLAEGLRQLPVIGAQLAAAASVSLVAARARSQPKRLAQLQLLLAACHGLGLTVPEAADALVRAAAQPAPVTRPPAPRLYLPGEGRPAQWN